MPEIPEGFVPARYKGHGIGLREGMAYYTLDGSKRESLSLEPGDEMLMRDEDIYGKTLLHDPQGNRGPLYLGLGRVILPLHQDLSDEERAQLGYEHHLGRPDFEPIEPLEKVLEQREKTKESNGISQTVLVEQSSASERSQEESEQS